MFVDVLFLEKSKKLKIVDILSEDTRIKLNGIGEENSKSSEEDDCFLLFKNWEEIRQITKSNCEENDTDFLRVIKSNDDIIETKENLNKFPLEIIGEENNNNINEIIKFLSLNKNECK